MPNDFTVTCCSYRCDCTVNERKTALLFFFLWSVRKQVFWHKLLALTVLQYFIIAFFFFFTEYMQGLLCATNPPPSLKRLVNTVA